MNLYEYNLFREHNLTQVQFINILLDSILLDCACFWT